MEIERVTDRYAEVTEPSEGVYSPSGTQGMESHNEEISEEQEQEYQPEGGGEGEYEQEPNENGEYYESDEPNEQYPDEPYDEENNGDYNDDNNGDNYIQNECYEDDANEHSDTGLLKEQYAQAIKAALSEEDDENVTHVGEQSSVDAREASHELGYKDASQSAVMKEPNGGYSLVGGRKSYAGMQMDQNVAIQPTSMNETDDFVKLTASHELDEVVPSSILVTPRMESIGSQSAPKSLSAHPETPPEIRKKLRQSGKEYTPPESADVKENKDPFGSKQMAETRASSIPDEYVQERKTRFSISGTLSPSSLSDPSPKIESSRTTSSISTNTNASTKPLKSQLASSTPKSKKSNATDIQQYQQPASEDEKDFRSIQENYYQLLLKDHTDTFLSHLQKNTLLKPISPLKADVFPEESHIESAPNNEEPVPVYGSTEYASKENDYERGKSSSNRISDLESPLSRHTKRSSISFTKESGQRSIANQLDAPKGISNKYAPGSRVGKGGYHPGHSKVSPSKSMNEIGSGKSATPHTAGWDTQHKLLRGYSAPIPPSEARMKSKDSARTPGSLLPPIRQQQDIQKLISIPRIAPITLPSIFGHQNRAKESSTTEYRRNKSSSDFNQRTENSRSNQSRKSRNRKPSYGSSGDESDESSFSFLSSDSKEDGFNPDHLTAMGKANYILQERQKQHRKLKRERDRVMLKWLGQLDSKYVSDEAQKRLSNHVYTGQPPPPKIKGGLQSIVNVGRETYEVYDD